jgi:general secretion pathway protein K
MASRSLLILGSADKARLEGRTEPGQQRGFALVTVLWAAMIVALLVQSVLVTGRTEARLAHNREALAQLGAIADAGLNVAILRLLDPRVEPPVDGSPFTLAFAGQQLRLVIQDEAGKIDLNAAQDELLRRLFRSVGADLETASALKDRILDWREPGIGKRLNGAKAPEYRAAGLAYGPRNGPFATVEEVQLVLGMTPELFAAIAPALTVYSQTRWIDPSFAPPEVLRALPGMDEGAIANLLLARASTSGRPAVMLGHAFTITAEADGPGEIHVKRSAVVRLTGRPSAPFWIYRWG